MTANGKSIVSKGKNVKEAVKIALDLLNAKIDAVDIEIMENESKGLLGLRVKPAVVRVTLREMAALQAAPAFSDPNSIVNLENSVQSLELPEPAGHSPFVNFKPQLALADSDDLLGKAWVKDGHILCKDAPDRYPLVSPTKGVLLYKNDELIEKTVVISENDILEVELQDEFQEPQWEFQISPDKMQAAFKLVPGTRIFRRLKDKAPDKLIKIEVTETKVPFIVDTREVMNDLRDSGIVYGIDYTEITKACASKEEGSFIIAKGTPPTLGKNGYFMPLQEVEIKKGLKERTDGSVDYREIQQFPSVEPGQVLGTVYLPIPGTPGLTVTNEPVLPPDVFPLVVRAGKGVVLVEDGTKVIATDSGHPDVKIKGTLAQISVIPKLLIGKDIDLQVGNVHYSGDVEIIGSVQDGMLVEAQGNVTVQDNVNMAKLIAGNSILVKNNIIASEVTAGKSSMLIAEIHQILGELVQQIRQMEAAIHQLSAVSAFKVSSFTATGLGPLIKILCDGKLKSFLPLTTSIINKIDSGTDILDKEWHEFSERLRKGFMNPHTSNFKSVEDIGQVAKKAEQLFISTIDDNDSPDCFIKVGFVHNSVLYSSGDIIITGAGVYQSKLRAGGFLEVDGYVRGGEIIAAKSVKIGEAGTKGGVTTKITVPQGETIKIKTVMEETVIQVGSQTHQFTAQSSNVFARLDENGQLIIH